MGRLARQTLIFLILAMSPLTGDLYAKKASKSRPSSESAKKVQQPKAPAKRSKIPAKRAVRQQTYDEKFAQVKARYREGKFSGPKFWLELTQIEENKEKLSKSNQAALGQIQAAMLMAEDYPVLSAIYAAEVLEKASNPLKEEYRKAWYVLSKVSHRRSMQDVIEDLAGKLKLGAKVPPYFGTDWFYYEGNAEVAASRPKTALSNYGRLQLTDRHYMTGKYQATLIHLENEDFKRAESALKNMLNAASYTSAPMPLDQKKELANYAKIGLARLYYQQQKFSNAIAFYRAVDRDSSHFYDALFEQSWAFFMGGYPNHALGALHGVESPFFKDVFNPEAAMLRGVVYYWMCRYDDSRSALADFTERNGEDVEALSDFLKRKRLTNEDAYSLLENHISGVSSASLGLSKRILETAATEDAVLLLRDQLAWTSYENERLDKRGIYSHKRSQAQRKMLNARKNKLKEKLGSQFLAELRTMKSEYDQLFEQAQFLYIELLMSEKEQLLGRELHASSKIDKVTRRKKIIGWANDAQSWSDSSKNEFWWDEVGFYIYDVKPLCKDLK